MMPGRAIAALIIGDEILTGKRRDSHFPHLIETLGKRGLTLAAVDYIGDDRDRLTSFLRASFARSDLVFSFGGIGATPDDHTRQSAAAALGVPLERHPEAVASIEQQFGAAAYPNRVLMAEFPHGATIIPNPVNRVAAFSVARSPFPARLPADGVADARLGARDALSAPGRREAGRARTGRARCGRKPAPSADERERRAVPARQAVQPAVVRRRRQATARARRAGRCGRRRRGVRASARGGRGGGLSERAAVA